MKKLFSSKVFFAFVFVLFLVLTIILLTSTVLDGAKYKNKKPAIYNSAEHQTYEYYYSYVFKDFTFQSITTYYDPQKSKQQTIKTSGLCVIENGNFTNPKLTRKSVFCLVDNKGEKYICTTAILLQVFYGIMLIVSSVWLIALFGINRKEKLKQLKKDE